MDTQAVERDRAVVLFAEDDTETRDVWKAVLELKEGYRVLEAVDGAAAIEVARRELPDVILMDLLMPVCDGLEATRALKAEPLTRKIPVIALSDYAWHETFALEALNLGCIACLEKRGEMVKVTELLRFVLSQTRNRASA